MHDETDKPKPYRVQMQFWLDRNREDHADIGDYLFRLKQQSKYASTIRDAVRLIMTLREGRADFLMQLFPNVQDMITRYNLERLYRDDQLEG